jgi:Na+/melibiose symporter-like transporter
LYVLIIIRHIFYVPFFFQAVKGTTAEGSGIRSIPYLVSIILASLIVGAGITILGWYKPFMIGGAVVFTIGAGLIYTFQVDTDTGKWVGYQLLAGLGAGAGVQIPFVAIQVVLSSKDMPTGNSLAIFFNSLGGAISISIAQNIFQNGLYKNVPKSAPNVSAEAVIKAGATYLRQLIPPADLPGVLQAYMASLDQAFVLSIVCGGLAAVFACFVENKSVKGHNLIPGGSA